MAIRLDSGEEPEGTVSGIGDRWVPMSRLSRRDFYDALVGYFFISGFYKLYPALANVEKIRILTGLQTDRTVYELLQQADTAAWEREIDR